jgi:hypothetical protein
MEMETTTETTWRKWQRASPSSSLPTSAGTRAGSGYATCRRARDAAASSISLTHATRDRDGTNEREGTDGRVGVARRSVKSMALTGEVDFVWSTWPGSRFSRSRNTKTSAAYQEA